VDLFDDVQAVARPERPLLRCVTPLAGTPTPEGGHADPDAQPPSFLPPPLRADLAICLASYWFGRTWTFTGCPRAWFEARVAVGSVLSCSGNDAASSRWLSLFPVARHLIMSRRLCQREGWFGWVRVVQDRSLRGAGAGTSAAGGVAHRVRGWGRRGTEAGTSALTCPGTWTVGGGGCAGAAT